MFQKVVRVINRRIQARKDFKKFKKCIKEDCKFVILISHNADGAGGAPVVLYEYAKYLKEQGFNIIFLVGNDGSLFANAENDKINIFLMYHMYKKYLSILRKAKIDYVIINTLLGYKYIEEIQKYKENKFKVIWWIHEEKRIIRKYKNMIPQKINNNIKIMCVSDRIKIDMQNEIKNDYEYGIMYYGCNDVSVDAKYKKYVQECSTRKDNKYIISVIGRICERKNQMQIIEAYNLIDKKIRDKMYINFVAGSYEDKYMRKLNEKIRNTKNINIIGPINRKDMYKVYVDSDLIICTSVDDPLPVVITEAMMYKKIFITSSETGQARLINNGINGMVYDVNSTEDLKEKILKCYYKEYDKNIKENERKLFLNYFSLEHLKKQIDLIDIEE